MPNHATGEIRNVAVVGHGGSGKTTLVESLLVAAGAIGAAGSVEKGTAVCDYEPEERAHQQSLWSACANLEHASAHVTLVDTPGYPDFLGRALPALAAVETAAVVVDARSGIQTTTRRMMDSAAERGLARLVIVNKIDAPDVDLDSLVESLRDAFGSECLPINLPAPGRGQVVDCYFDPDLATATEFSSVEEAQSRVVDQAVEMDEELMETFLEQGEVSADELRGAFRSALRAGHLVPVCFASAATGAGVELLLAALAQLMPGPGDGNRSAFSGADGTAIEVDPDPAAAVVAHVFRVTIDPFVGRLSTFRIHSGTVTRDTQLYADDGRKPFKVGHLFRLQGKEHQEVDEGVPGDICAVAKVDEIAYGTVLHTAGGGDAPRPEPVRLPEAMYGLAIQAKTRGDEQKLSDTLAKLAAEDPSFHVEHSAATRETVIHGLGELHLRMMLERMKERYNVEVETRPPRIPYRETITAPADGHHRHKKQTGGAGQFGEVFLRVEPKARGEGFEFVDSVVGGVIPSQFVPAVEKGIRQVLEAGAIAGYRMDDVKVTVYDGKHHPVDSKEIAFVTAGKKAFLDAVGKARPIVLEPVVELEVTVPQGNMGDVAGDLSGKRGRVAGTESLAGGYVSITGQAPLSELTRYQTELKSVTGGAGSYTMGFSHYDPVPRPIQQKLMAEFKPAADED